MTMRVRKAVIPAAGLGTRFLPLTKSLPKEMLPLVDKPVIQYAVEEALASGCQHVVLVTSRGQDMLEDYFDSSFELEKTLEERGKLDVLEHVRQVSNMVNLLVVRQKQALGLGHAVLTARELVGNEPFAVILPDDVIDAPVPCLKQMIEVYNQTGSSVVAAEEVAHEQISSYGVLDAARVEGKFGGRAWNIRSLVEKPQPQDAPSNLAIIGRYVLTPRIFEMLERTPRGAGGEIQLTDGMRLLLEQEKIYGYVFQGTRHDTGHKIGFLKANIAFALKRPELADGLRAFLKQLNV